MQSDVCGRDAGCKCRDVYSWRFLTTLGMSALGGKADVDDGDVPRCPLLAAPAMIELAHTLHPHLDFREGSAEELPLDSSSFDAVISGFGVGHFSRPERVLAEFARVLIPKGRVALSWWDGFGKNRINGIFFEAINELRISAPDALPAGPAVDTFSDPTEFVAVLRAAGFEVISFSHPLKSVDELWDLALGSFVRVSTVIRAQTADVQQRLRAKVEQIAKQYASANGLQIPIAFRVIAGIR